MAPSHSLAAPKLPPRFEVSPEMTVAALVEKLTQQLISHGPNVQALLDEISARQAWAEGMRLMSSTIYHSGSPATGFERLQRESAEGAKYGD
jgi:hypothetical protein